MTDSHIDLDQLTSRLRDFFGQQSDVRLAYLYGSVARGATWAESDLDLGVMMDDALSPYEQFRRTLRMRNDIEALQLVSMESDVRLLNDAPIEFLWQVYYYGQRVFARDDQERVNFEVRVMQEWFDFKPVLDEYYRAMFERIKTGEPSAQSRKFAAEIREIVNGRGIAEKLSAGLARRVHE